MKVWKMISGILSLLAGLAVGLFTLLGVVLTFFLTYSSKGYMMSALGILIGALTVAGGIINLATCRRRRRSNIAPMIIFAVACGLCFIEADPFFYLVYLAVWDGICAIVALVFLCIPDKGPAQPVAHGARYITPQFTPDAHFASDRIGAPPVRQYSPQAQPQPGPRPPQYPAPTGQYPPQYPAPQGQTAPQPAQYPQNGQQ